MVAPVSRDFFAVLGVQSAMGRGFAPEEQRYNTPVTAMVSYAYWKQSLGATKDLSAARLKIANAQPGRGCGRYASRISLPGQHRYLGAPRILTET